MTITAHVPAVLENIAKNLKQVEIQLKASQTAVADLDAESLASIKQLLAKWEHPQAIAQHITAVLQSEGLAKAAAEMEAAVAVLSTAHGDASFLQKVEERFTASSGEAANN